MLRVRSPVTTREPSSHYWGIDQIVQYGSATILSDAAGIVDTATTLILIKTDAFKRYQNMTGATVDSKTGLLSITPSQYSQLQTLRFIIGGVRHSSTLKCCVELPSLQRPFDLIPDAQIWPRTLNKAIGGDPNGIYLIIANIGSSHGIDFINGMVFLERFLSVYDSDENRVGFAETAHTADETNYQTSAPPTH
jgi:saccharopepsin